jgi:hypothetical protein
MKLGLIEGGGCIKGFKCEADGLLSMYESGNCDDINGTVSSVHLGYLPSTLLSPLGGAFTASLETSQGGTLTFGWIEETYGYLAPSFTSNGWEFFSAFFSILAIIATTVTTAHFGRKYDQLRTQTALLYCIIQFLWLLSVTMTAILWLKNRSLFLKGGFER